MAIRPRFWVVLNEVKDLKIAAFPSGARNDGRMDFFNSPVSFDGYVGRPQLLKP